MKQIFPRGGNKNTQLEQNYKMETTQDYINNLLYQDYINKDQTAHKQAKQTPDNEHKHIIYGRRGIMTRDRCES